MRLNFDIIEQLNKIKLFNNIRMWQYVRNVKKRIEKSEFKNFDSWHIIDNSGYVDFVFIGNHKGREVVWNACISTTKGDYFDKVDAQAMDEAYEKYPLPENYDFKSSFIKMPGTKYYEYKNPNPELSDARHRWMAERTIELMNSKTISIIPWEIEIDETYRYGVGLHIRVDVDRINISNVENFITEFNKHGTDVFKDKNNTPVTFSADELGVELKSNAKFVGWKDSYFSHNTSGINI